MADAHTDAVITGLVEPGFEPVREAFAHNFERGRELPRTRAPSRLPPGTQMHLGWGAGRVLDSRLSLAAATW